MKNVFTLDNPEAKASLLRLRDKSIGIAEFRRHAGILAACLIEYSISGIKDSKDVVVISILRSSLEFLPAVIKYLPSAGVGFAGLARDEQTAIAAEYYWKIPDLKKKIVLIPDPMLATGGSTLHVLRKIRIEDPKEIRIVSTVSAPEGIEAIHNEFPEVKIFTASLDKGLDSKKFIIPGLGDFGDRYFGTF